LSCEKHPDSDHLHVLQVDEGKKYGIHQIVCGAPNARAKASRSSLLKNRRRFAARDDSRRATIRGVDSDGMCCALYTSSASIRNILSRESSALASKSFPEDAEIGQDRRFKAYLGLDDADPRFGFAPVSERPQRDGERRP
jgi:phenylalanyl-tRNA synthetase beta chain